MSALPAAQPNGQKRDPPPPGARPLNRTLKPRPKNIALVPRKTGPSRPTSFRPPPKKDGFKPPDNSEQRWDELKAKRAANGGWSETPSVPYKDYPLYTTKRALRDGIRYHVMRFNRAKDETSVDPTNQDQFPRPVSLHRRDARTSQFGRALVKEEEKPENPVDEAEAERQRLWKEQKEAQRAAEQAQIAPVLKQAEQPKPAKLDKRQKALSTYYPKHTEEAKKAAAIRYEETLPWHLEDVDGKNVWVGSYVAALSEVNVALVISGGGFRMIPLERYYKFNHRPAHKLLSLEQAEKIMGKTATDVDRWVLQDQKRQEMQQEIADTRKWLGGGAKVKMESETSRAIPKAERRDDNDIDLSGDEFQDDDENPGFDADDEETKDTKERLRRDHLGASIFDEVKEEEVEKEEKEEKLVKMHEKQGKKFRKTLVRLDHNYMYASDSDSGNPFESSSESSSEEGKDKDGEDKKDEDKKTADQKDKLGSGPTTKDNNNTTPSGKQKAPDLTKKVKSLKRPASPNASESSGNESSRKLKKIKKNLPAGSSANASRSGTPLPGGGPKRGGGGAAASDGEGTAGEGSDGGLKPKPKKIKLKTGSGANSTPIGSRPGSPAPPAGVATHDYASRPAAGSASPQAAAAVAGGPPAGAPSPSASRPAASTKPITGEEIVELIMSNGGAITIQDLLQRFKGRVGDKPGQMLKADWVKLVKNHAAYHEKMLRPKTARASEKPDGASS